jgi:hypothetical protein
LLGCQFPELGAPDALGGAKTELLVFGKVPGKRRSRQKILVLQRWRGQRCCLVQNDRQGRYRLCCILISKAEGNPNQGQDFSIDLGIDR